jgi:hypothetical protein
VKSKPKQNGLGKFLIKKDGKRAREKCLFIGHMRSTKVSLEKGKEWKLGDV